MANPKCSECNKTISYYSTKCMDCWNLIKIKKHYCIDCNTQVSQAGVKRCRACWAKVSASKRKTDAHYTRRAKIKMKYKLTLEQYEEMLVAQDYKCAICHIDQSEFKHPLCVDHDRTCCPTDITCGKCIRGLLCSQCNIGIGGLKDDEQRILSAIDYVRKYKMITKEKP